MLDRIKLILQEKGLNSSSFADTIQVSRGTVSHILSGRNNPSKGTVDKILIAFPDISSSWLIKGEGPMYKRDRVTMQPISTPPSGQLGLFDEKKTVESSVESKENEYPLKKEVKTYENKIHSTVVQEINLSKNISKKIDKIIIFFSDKTFMTFISEE